MRYFISLITLIITLSISVNAVAGEILRYNFPVGQTLPYTVSVNSDLKLVDLGDLAKLLNITKIKHNVEMDADLTATSIARNGHYILRVAVTRVSMVMIIGDSILTDNGEKWGGVKPGTVYEIEITDRGQIVGLNRNTQKLPQIIQVMQKLFPIMPETAISPGYQWTDASSFEAEFIPKTPQAINSSIDYMFSGLSENYQNSCDINYRATGASSTVNNFSFNGDGLLTFNKAKGQLTRNFGKFAIDARIDFSVLNMPANWGSTPVHIDSDIKVKLKDAQ